MTTIASEANFDQWLDQVKEQAGEDYYWMADWYSFLTAYEEGMKPSEAIKDAKEWLNEE